MQRMQKMKEQRKLIEEELKNKNLNLSNNNSNQNQTIDDLNQRRGSDV